MESLQIFFKEKTQHTLSSGGGDDTKFAGVGVLVPSELIDKVTYILRIDHPLMQT